MYQEAVATYNAANPGCPFVAQYGAQIELHQVHVPGNQLQNSSDNDAICILLHNRISMDWDDHAYTYGMVYFEQQFHQPTMSLDIFKDIDDKRLQHLAVYGTPLAIPQWDGWHGMSEEDHYCLLFKCAEKSTNNLVPVVTGL
ncbi:hypothetical protein C0993_001136, partial [Termitomyces sp. T159_Od127]